LAAPQSIDMKKRLPTAIVLLSLFFVIVQYGSRILTFVVFQALILAALVEFYALAEKRNLHPETVLGVILSVLLGLAFFWRSSVPLGLAIFGIVLVGGVYYLFRYTLVEQLPYFIQSMAITVLGVVYLGFTLNYVYLLRAERGPYILYFFCTIIFLGDTGAYVIGKLLGRHKMTPLASPNKTWEGSAGGILFAVLGAWAARAILLRDVDLWLALGTGVVVHAVAQMSDPLESLFKRAVGVKDSSNILPGHGGFLDRIDSFILAAPFFYYLIIYFWK
jgi:phosphatidate cytidylyltransferase